jgi:hypothetical protein
MQMPSEKAEKTRKDMQKNLKPEVAHSKERPNFSLILQKHQQLSSVLSKAESLST